LYLFFSPGEELAVEVAGEVVAVLGEEVLGVEGELAGVVWLGVVGREAVLAGVV
jgi:hypothetical protein